ncbi:RsiV family protein, partial [Acinetobacter venetianus]|uniref:RsiV family protein n=1 Tax=Acinetobacter venetianus TaxID=52133 RepID=UPI00241CADDC
NDPKEYEEAWPFQVTDNFLLGEQGLILQYGEYEIGPYVVGLPRLVIPFDQLKGVLKPEYLPQVEAPAASTLAASTAT